MEENVTGEQVLEKLKNSGIQVKDISDPPIFVPQGKEAGPGFIQNQNEQALAFWQERWFKQALENWTKIKKDETAGVHQLDRKYVGKAAVIVGAGPTLDKHYSFLKRLPEDWYIISSNSTLKNLAANKITPDFVHCFDAFDHSKDFEGVNTRHMTMWCPSSTHPDTLQAWDGFLLHYNLYHPGVQLFEQCLHWMYPKFIAVSNSGCVVNESLRICYRLGFDLIVLVGVEFGFPDDKYRAKIYNRRRGRWFSTEPEHDKLLRMKPSRIENGVKCFPEHFLYKLGLLQIIQECQGINVLTTAEKSVFTQAELPYKPLKQILKDWEVAKAARPKPQQQTGPMKTLGAQLDEINTGTTEETKS